MHGGTSWGAAPVAPCLPSARLHLATGKPRPTTARVESCDTGPGSHHSQLRCTASPAKCPHLRDQGQWVRVEGLGFRGS